MDKVLPTESQVTAIHVTRTVDQNWAQLEQNLADSKFEIRQTSSSEYTSTDPKIDKGNHMDCKWWKTPPASPWVSPNLVVKVRILPNHSNKFLMWRNITGQAQTMFQMAQDDKISAQTEK